MDELQIAPATWSDLDEIAALHIRAFPGAALTILGPELLVRYYRWLLDPSHDGGVITARRAGRLVGFCAAGVFRGAVGGFLERNRLVVAREILRRPRLLATPIVRERLVLAARILVRRALQRRRQSQPSPQVRPLATGARPYGILSIATDPSEQGRGVGQLLMQTCEADARRRGFASMVLTVHPDNTRAVRFYERQGWLRDRDSSKPWTGTMKKVLMPASANV